jgi:CheY-like chemotaxis protein
VPRTALLLVEDDPNDAFFLSRAFRRIGVDDTLIVAKDGQEASDCLMGRGAYRDRESFPVPDVIILDLKLPRMNGFEFLSWLRHSIMRAIPVVVFTASADPKDIELARALGVVSYLVKPGGFERMSHCASAIRSIRDSLREGKAVVGGFPWVP